MFTRSFLVRLSSLTIALSMLLQSSVIGFAPRTAAAQRLKKNEAPRLQSAYTITGGKRTLRIVFDQPVRFVGEDPADFIFVADEDSDERIELSDLPNSFSAVNPEQYGGHEFATVIWNTANVIVELGKMNFLPQWKRSFPGMSGLR